MPSPFPGMDPFIEVCGIFEDFHFEFLGNWRYALNRQLPDGYVAVIGERYYLAETQAGDAARRREVIPDIAIEVKAEPAASSASGVATLEPEVRLHVIPDETREAFIEIRRESDRSLVTVMELLSPSNKDSRGRSAYIDKQQAVLSQPVHLFELDLLLTGPRFTLSEPLPAGDYYAFLSRAKSRPRCEVFTWAVSAKLPTLPIPLKAPDDDLLIDFQSVFDETFERGNYRKLLDYAADVNLPVSDAIREWISGVL